MPITNRQSSNFRKFQASRNSIITISHIIFAYTINMRRICYRQNEHVTNKCESEIGSRNSKLTKIGRGNICAIRIREIFGRRVCDGHRHRWSRPPRHCRNTERSNRIMRKRLSPNSSGYLSAALSLFWEMEMGEKGDKKWRKEDVGRFLRIEDWRVD